MLSSYKTRNAGFTLIEALVALLVLSIGLLGVAAMQLKALQGAHAAYQRSIASLAAQDAQERLWKELAVVTDGAESITCPTTDNFTSIESEWHRNWVKYLPGLSSSPIDSSNIADCEFLITVAWDEERFGGGGESFAYTVRLPDDD